MGFLLYCPVLLESMKKKKRAVKVKRSPTSQSFFDLKKKKSTLSISHLPTQTRTAKRRLRGGGWTLTLLLTPPPCSSFSPGRDETLEVAIGQIFGVTPAAAAAVAL